MPSKKVPIKKDPSPRWMAFYWIALFVVWALYGLQMVLSYIGDYQNPYAGTTLIIPIICRA
jgi:hypothetical protein